MFYVKNNENSLFIKKDTKIYGGKDTNNKDIIFKTKNNLKIDSMNIKTLRTISRINFTENQDKICLYDSYKIAEYNMEEIYEKNQFLYLFSKKKENDIHFLDTKNNTLGNILSSKILKLTEGLRKIKLKFFLCDQSLTEIIEQIKKITHLNEGINEHIKKYTEFLSKSLKIKFTTQNGLVELNKSNINVIYDKNNKSIDIDLTLDYDMPGLDIYTGFYIKDIPSILILANDKTTFWAFLQFINIKYSKIKIITSVEKYNKLFIQNDIGVIDSNISFQLFGPVPQVNSSVYIASDEIFNKKISSLKIKIKWRELPEYNFEYYYKNYRKNITTSSFKVRISFLKNKEWIPINDKDKQIINLFELDENKNIKKETVLNINIEKLNLNYEDSIEYKTTHLSASTIGGFLKIELVEPSFAFCHKLHADILTKTILDKKNIILKNYSPLDIKIPYTPVVEKITIDYTSEIDIHDNSQSCCIINRIHPFGYFNILAIKTEKQDKTKTFEDLYYKNNSNICIEITNLTSQYINLYFVIDENTSKTNEEKLNTKIGFISNNECIFFKDNEIIVDETKGFTKSGTIKIKIPKINNFENTYQLSNNNKSIWIEIWFLENRSVLPTIIGIYSNCVNVIRFSDNENLSIPPNTLTTIEDNKNTNIKILQPFKSSGGYKKETDSEMFLRIKNRLQNKGRCVSDEDYTNFILENFKEVKYAKIIKNTGINTYEIGKNYNSQSSYLINILVILHKKEYFCKDKISIEADNNLLNRIKNKLEKYCSPFVNLNIINPHYEKLKVIIRVNFKNILDEKSLKEKLNRDILYFISPWLINKDIEISISSKFSVLELVKYLKSKSYINIIENIYILKITDNKIKYTYNFNDVIYPENNYSIFISSEEHKIISNNNYENIKKNINIENARINEDLIVGAEKLETENTNPSNRGLVDAKETQNEYFIMFHKN